ncbi:unnamed protein product, partial [Mesorhabditis spiculigera]
MKAVDSLLPALRRFFTPIQSRFNSASAGLTQQETVKLLYKQVHDARTIATPSDLATIKLEPRKMADSLARVTVRLSGSGEERRRYLTAKGTVRMGRLLEDLDHYAVWLCYLHNRSDVTKLDSPPSLPRSIVTGCVDRIGYHGVHLGDRDLILEGHVSWVGRSSMETTIRVFQDAGDQSLKQVLKANFVLVSRDANDLNSVMPVHPLTTTTPEEAAIMHQGAEANRERKYKEKRSLLKVPPTPDEWKALHQIFLSNLNQTNSGNYTVSLRPGQKWMKNTEMRNTELCFPEFQNIYGKVFGGFLMREAVELAFICAKYFSKGSVSLVSTDDILFREAVNIGDLIQFTARVTYTEKNFMQIRVYAETCDEEFQQTKMTNEFSFTFSADDSREVHQVVPDDYGAGMLYLSGKRNFEKVKRFCIDC